MASLHSESGTEPARLARLDGLRGLAAAGVALHHVFYHFAAWPLVLGGAIALWLKDWGWTLVDLFFVLSGTVFAHVYRREGRLRAPGAIGDFWMARVARLYPLHLACLVLMAIFAGGRPENTAAAFIAQVAMLQGLVGAVARNYDYPSWSLSIEMVCYAVFAAAAVRGERALAWVSGLAVYGAAFWLWFVAGPGGPYAADVLARGLLGFFLGQVLWQFRTVLARVPAALLAALLAVGFLLQTGSWSPILPLTVLVWAPALLLSLRLRWLETPAMVWLGDRSYAIYLLNLPIILGADALLAGRMLSPGMVLVVQAALVLAMGGAAEASSRWLEVPARRAIRGWWEARAAARLRASLPEPSR